MLHFKNIRLNSLRNISEAFDERSGKIVSLVLDYSHNLILSRDVMAAYLPHFYLNSPVPEYKRTPTCGNFTFIPSRDVFYGVCDLVTVKALTPASCCHICNSYVMKSTDKGGGNSCNGFTFLQGANSCQLKSCIEKDIKNVIHSDVEEGAERMARYRLIAEGGVSAYLTPVDETAETLGSHVDDGISRSEHKYNY